MNPLALCFTAYVVTFAATRAVTRLIRCGRGPFRDVTAGGTHIHHSAPGTVLLVVGALTAVGSSGPSARAAAALLVGAGASLVLDEFALIVHLRDVYWSREGLLSIDISTLTAACLLLCLVGFSPLGAAWPTLAVNVAGAATCALKGKYRLGLIGAFVPFLAMAGAVRLARPGSLWCSRRYSETRRQRAAQRAASFDARFGPWGRRFRELVGGAASA